MLIPAVKSRKDEREELVLSRKSYLIIPKKYYDAAQSKLFKELFFNFTSRYCKLTVRVAEGDIPCAVLGTKPYPLREKDLGDNDYALQIDGEKAYLFFHDSPSFAHAFCTLLQLIETRFQGAGAACTLPVTQIEDQPTADRRMTHVCAFAESTFHKIRRTVREAGFLKYSHIVLEFWGTYRYQCNKHLSRKNAFTKKQVALLVEEARALGMQVVPMLNIWGHAPMNRVKYGKHTALENSLKMQPYFSKSGWEWNIQSPQVFALHKRMIDELIEVCKGAEYFHIGCDESYTFGEDRDLQGRDIEGLVCKYINSVNDYVKSKGLKTLMWGDMLLCNPEWDSSLLQSGTSPAAAQKLCEHLSKDIVIVDWQYSTTVDPIPTAAFLAAQGFTVMLAPWRDIPTMENCLKNVRERGYYGLLFTTWHLLSTSPTILSQGASVAWTGGKADDPKGVYLANYVRKLLPSKRYEDNGFAEYELESK